MSKPPLVSVLMVVRNGMPYIRQAVESLLRQSMAEWELIVADDGSTDQTPVFIRSVADSRVRYFTIEGGYIAARNFTLRIAQARWAAVLDADDLSMPHRLERQYQFLQEHPECVLVGAQVEDIDPEGRPLRRREFPLTDEALRWRLFFGSPFIHPSTMFLREAALQSGGYRAEFPVAEDYDLFCRLAERGRLANLPDCLLQYRVHPDSLTTKRLELEVRFAAQAAAEYAQRHVPGIAPAKVRDLYYFLCADRDPAETSPDAMAEVYRQIRTAWLANHPEPSEELRCEMARLEQVLRWRCLERAERLFWRRPWQAWHWLRLAAHFDPQHGTLRQILLRALKKRFRKSTPMK